MSPKGREKASQKYASRRAGVEKDEREAIVRTSCRGNCVARKKRVGRRRDHLWHIQSDCLQASVQAQRQMDRGSCAHYDAPHKLTRRRKSLGGERDKLASAKSSPARRNTRSQGLGSETYSGWNEIPINHVTFRARSAWHPIGYGRIAT